MHDAIMDALQAFDPAKFCADFVLTNDVLSGLAQGDRQPSVSRKDLQALQRVHDLIRAQNGRWVNELGVDQDTFLEGLKTGGTAIERGQGLASELSEEDEIGEGAPRHEAKWLADFVISADFVKGTFSSTNPGLELSRKDRDAIERVVGVMEAQYLYYLGIATGQGFEDRELVAGLRAGGTAVDRGQAMASGGLR